MYTPTTTVPDEFACLRALVTGGSRGIGAAVAQRLIDGGARVVTVSRSRSEDTPKDSTFLSADIRAAEGASAVVEQAIEVLGGLDILVNNAGAARVHLDGNISDEEWLDSLNINFLSAVRVTTAALSRCGSRSTPRSSTSLPTPPSPAALPMLHYAAAKAALDVYGVGLAAGRGAQDPGQHHHAGIGPDPGRHRGPRGDRGRHGYQRSRPGARPCRWAGPATRATSPRPLSSSPSDRAQWITGENWKVDGGQPG